MIVHRENASVAAIERLTDILVKSMNKNTEQTPQSDQQIVKSNPDQNKTNNDKILDNNINKFNQFFEISKDTNKQKHNQENVITVEIFLQPQKSLMNTTRDYTEELEQINNTHCNDPNIPLNDAIEAKNKGMKDIETVNIMVKSIREMQKQIVILQKNNTDLKNEVEKIKLELSHEPSVRKNDKIKPTQTEKPKVIDTKENQVEDTEQNQDEFQIQKSRKNRKRQKIEVTQISPGPGEVDLTGDTPPIAYAKVLMKNIKPPKTKITEKFQEELEKQGAQFKQNDDTEKPIKKIHKTADAIYKR